MEDLTESLNEVFIKLKVEKNTCYIRKAPDVTRHQINTFTYRRSNFFVAKMIISKVKRYIR